MIWLILVLALVLRLINLNQSLWLDEAINVVFAKSSQFWWFVTEYPIGDFHPPGWFAVLWLWGYVFGFGEISVRLPSVIFGVATVYLTFLLGKELFDKKVGLLAAFFLAVAPLHVYYSQEARMYVFAAFSVTLSFYFLNRVILKRKWAWLGFVVSLILVLYSNYLAYLIIPAQIFYLFLFRKMYKTALIVGLTAAIFLIPWLSVLPAQLNYGMNKAVVLPAWNEVVGGANLKNLLLIPIKTFFGRVTFSDKTFYMIISGLTGLVFGSLLIRGIKRENQATKLLVCWIFIPVILGFLISFFIPVLAYFRMIFILPALYLILACGIHNLPKKYIIPASVFILLVSSASLLGYYLNPSFQREDWKGAINFVSQRVNDQAIVIFENDEIPAPVIYYGKNLSNLRAGLSRNLESDLENKKKVFLFEYLVDIYDPKRAVSQKLRSLKFYETNIYDFNGVGFVREYIKQ